MKQLDKILSCPQCLEVKNHKTDKVSLKRLEGQTFFCPKCKTKYPKIKNVYLLLPKNELRKLRSLPNDLKGEKQEEELVDWKFISYQYYIRYNKFVKYVNQIIKDDLVLDIGCASAPLAYNFKNYLGLDNSLKLISFASQHIDNPLFLADARYLPFKNKSIPFFISRNLLEHTFEETKILQELKRVASKGGFFELPCSDQISWFLDPINLLFLKLKKKHFKAFTYGYGHINMLSLKEWQNRLLNTGFQTADCKEMGKGLIFNLVSFLESLFLSYGDNDFIPAKMVSRKIYKRVSKFYDFLNRVDPKITKAWTKLFYVKVQ